jgi:hypothetical protein
VRPEIFGERRIEIVRLVRVGGAVVLLGVEALPRQIPIGKCRRNLVRRNRQGRRTADVPLATIVVCRPHNRVGRHFRLIDRRNWLRLTRQAAFHPAKLRRVQRRQLHHRDLHVAAVVE